MTGMSIGMSMVADDVVTVISVFSVEAVRQRELVALLERNADALLTTLDGFVGAALHASTDGTRVINYAQWRDQEALRAMLTDDRVREHQHDVAELATVEPFRCMVRSVHQRPGSSLASGVVG